MQQGHGQAVDLAHELGGVGVGAQLAGLDRLQHGAAQGGTPAHDLVEQQLAQLALAVVEFEGAGDVDATGVDLDVAHAHDPPPDDLLEPGQPLGLLHRRHEHVGDEAPAVLLDHRLLQRLARADAREHAALGQLEPVGHALQGDGLQPLGRREVDRGADDGGAGQLAFLRLGVHAADFAHDRAK